MTAVELAVSERIRLEIDRKAVQRLIERRELTLDNCNCIEGSGKIVLRSLFLHALRHKLTGRQCEKSEKQVKGNRR